MIRRLLIVITLAIIFSIPAPKVTAGNAGVCVLHVRQGWVLVAGTKSTNIPYPSEAKCREDMQKPIELKDMLPPEIIFRRRA